MSKRLLALLLCGLLLVSLSACGEREEIPVDSASGGEPLPTGPETDGKENWPADNSGEKLSDKPDEKPEDTPQPLPEPEVVTIEAGQVLLEWEGVRVTTRDLKGDGFMGQEVGILVENNSQNTVLIGTDDAVINGYMISTLCSVKVAPGKKANDTVTLSRSGLEQSGIETLLEMKLRFHVSNPDTYRTQYEGREVTVRTSAYGKKEQPKMDQGVEIYNQDGLRAVALYLGGDGVFGPEAMLFLENNSGALRGFRCKDVSVNGFMVDGSLYCDLLDGTMAVDSISLHQSDLKENGITQVETLEFKLKIIDPDSYNTLVTTEPIVLNLNK